MGQYRVLARRYRPKTFEDMVGQDVVAKTLSNAVKCSRVVPVYLFTGIQGVGKTTFARIMAKALNCEHLDCSGDYVAVCNTCDHCTSIDKGQHPDVREIDAASHNGVSDIREILDDVAYRPVLGRTKVYIFDEVHMLSSAAFNAFLKTLEEPAENVCFILATTEVRKIPVTILSRCQAFRLQRVPVDVLKDFLVKICLKENFRYEDESLFCIARYADGSVRDALSLLDQAISLSDDLFVSLSLIEVMIHGALSSTEMESLGKALLARCSTEVMAILDRLYASGVDPHDLLQGLVDFFYKKIMSCVESWDRESVHALRCWQVLLKGFEELGWSSYPFQCVRIVCVKCLYLADMPTPAEIVSELQSIRDSASENIGVAEKPLEQPFIPVPETYELLVDLCLRHKEMIFYSFLFQEVGVIVYDSKSCILTLGTNVVDAEEKVIRLRSLLKRWTGRNWQINIQPRDLSQDTISELKEKEKIDSSVCSESFYKDLESHFINVQLVDSQKKEK